VRCAGYQDVVVGSGGMALTVSEAVKRCIYTLLCIIVLSGWHSPTGLGYFCQRRSSLIIMRSMLSITSFCLFAGHSRVAI